MTELDLGKPIQGDVIDLIVEGHQALLAVLDLAGTDTESFDEAVEELAKVVNHHLTEEELTILNPAREEVAQRTRAELGEAFASRRDALIDQGCGVACCTSTAS